MFVVFQVLVRESDQPPDQSEYDPTENERHGEDQQVVSPLDVDHRRKYVGEKASSALVDVNSRYVAFAVLADEATLRQSRYQPAEAFFAQYRRHLFRFCATELRALALQATKAASKALHIKSVSLRE